MRRGMPTGSSGPSASQRRPMLPFSDRSAARIPSSDPAAESPSSVTRSTSAALGRDRNIPSARRPCRRASRRAEPPPPAIRSTEPRPARAGTRSTPRRRGRRHRGRHRWPRARGCAPCHCRPSRVRPTMEHSSARCIAARRRSCSPARSWALEPSNTNRLVLVRRIGPCQVSPVTGQSRAVVGCDIPRRGPPTGRGPRRVRAA